MTDIKNADFAETLPPALKADDTMRALATLAARELSTTAAQVQKNVIYTMISQMPEYFLDILAEDMHVDWYNYDYPIEAKQELIRDSIRVHQRLGTKASVERALSGIHPNSRIEEWFSYGGKPYYFKIILDASEARIKTKMEDVVSTVDIYKRLTAHIEAVNYEYKKTAGQGIKTYIKSGVSICVRGARE